MEWVVAHFHPFIERQIRLRLGEVPFQNDEVEELAADVWMIALQRLRDLRPRNGRYTPVLIKFLGTTAIYQCNNFLRRHIKQQNSEEKQNRRSSSLDALAQDTRDVVSRVITNEIMEHVSACLKEMPPDKEQILVFRLIEQRSNAEIAAKLGLKPNTVAKRYRRALEDLRKGLPKSIFDNIWTATGRANDLPDLSEPASEND